MSSMSGQQFNTKSMTGISNSYVNNIITDAIEVTTNLTVDNGAVVILPNSSISDNALSSNVPLKNSSNIFTNTQIISNQNILQIKGTSGYARLQYIDTGNYLELQNMTSSGIIRIKATGSTGLTTFSMDISSTGFNIYKSLFLSNSASITFPDTTIQTTAYPGSSNFALLNANNIFTGVTNTFPTPSTSDNSQTVCTTAFVKNQSYITASSLAPYALLASDNTFTGTGNNVPMPLLTDNSLIIANTSFVKGQNYITASALSPYALLATNNTFLGTANTMPTPATATNSTVVATTAFVKAQLYSPLAGTNTFTGICTFNNAGPTIINQLAMPSSSSQLFTVLNSGFIGAVQLSIPNATRPKYPSFISLI